MTDDELRAGAIQFSFDKYESGEATPLAAMGHAILRLLDENADLQKRVDGHCERIAKQSELLSRKAEKADHAKEMEIALWGTQEQRDKQFEERLQRQGWLKKPDESLVVSEGSD